MAEQCDFEHLLDDLPEDLQQEANSIFLRGKEQFSGVECNDICQECKEHVHANFVSCVSHANSPEARKDCERVYFEDTANCQNK